MHIHNLGSHAFFVAILAIRRDILRLHSWIYCGVSHISVAKTSTSLCLLVNVAFVARRDALELFLSTYIRSFSEVTRSLAGLELQIRLARPR